jgi:spermidine/putrescine transport system substrate-binding protein
LLEPFEKQFDVKVNVKDYEGTGTALALLEQSQRGDWDVFVVDSVDVPRVVEAGLLAPLPEAEFPWSDIFPELRQEDLHFKDGEMYAVPKKFGYNTLAYNKAKADPRTCAKRRCCGTRSTRAGLLSTTTTSRSSAWLRSGWA